MKSQRVAWVSIAAALLAGALMSVVALASSSGIDQNAQKAAIDRREAALQAQLMAGPHGVKPTDAHLLPVTRHYQTGIWPFRFGPFSGGKNIVNLASVVSSRGVHYTVYAGASDTAPQQGVLLVFRDADPPFYVTGESSQAYLDPIPEGALTITSIVGNRIVFRSASGRVGSFDVMTAQFSG